MNKFLYAVLAFAFAASSVAERALGQTTDFRCAPPNTIVDYSDGSRATWLGTDGNRCKGQFRDKDGNEFPFVWYLPTVGLRADRSLAFAEQIKPWTMWPLVVGKKISGRFDGVTGGIGHPYNLIFHSHLCLELAQRLRSGGSPADPSCRVPRCRCMRDPAPLQLRRGQANRRHSTSSAGAELRTGAGSGGPVGGGSGGPTAAVGLARG